MLRETGFTFLSVLTGNVRDFPAPWPGLEHGLPWWKQCGLLPWFGIEACCCRPPVFGVILITALEEQRASGENGLSSFANSSVVMKPLFGFGKLLRG